MDLVSRTCLPVICHRRDFIFLITLVTITVNCERLRCRSLVMPNGSVPNVTYEFNAFRFVEVTPFKILGGTMPCTSSFRW